jgi:hemoglobin
MGVPGAPAHRSEIRDVDDVELLVRRFYQAVIPDPLLGPIFHDLPVDWAVHIPKLVDFWAGRLLGLPGYIGNPVGAHQPVLDRFPFGAAELDRWLELWEETVDELFVGAVAELAKERAHMAADAIGSLARRHAVASSGAGHIGVRRAG